MPEVSTIVIALTTFPVDGDVEAFARALVGERLAACVNVVDGVTSIYRWQDAVQVDRERQLIIKTSADRVDALRERVLALHPYDVPEFLVLPVIGGGEAYMTWVEGSTAPG